MAELSTDRLVQIVLGLAAAGGLGFSGLSAEQASTCADQVEHWREELSLERADSQAREIRDSDLCQEMIESVCSR